MDITILGRELAINKYAFIFHHKQDPLESSPYSCVSWFRLFVLKGCLMMCLDIARKVPLSLIVHRYLLDFKSLKVKVLNCYFERPKQDDPRCSSSSWASDSWLCGPWPGPSWTCEFFPFVKCGLQSTPLFLTEGWVRPTGSSFGRWGQLCWTQTSSAWKKGSTDAHFRAQSSSYEKTKWNQVEFCQVLFLQCYCPQEAGMTSK